MAQRILESAKSNQENRPASLDVLRKVENMVRTRQYIPLDPSEDERIVVSNHFSSFILVNQNNVG